MRFLLFMFSLAIVVWAESEERSPRGSRWEKLNEFDKAYHEYSEAAQSVVKEAKRTITEIRAKSTSFINKFFNSSIEIAVANNITRNGCSEAVFNYLGVRRSFLAHITKSEVPLRTHIAELEEKLNEINSTIKMYHDVAESKYWSCKLSNDSCIDNINAWLENERRSIACKMRPCTEHRRREKRRANSCRSDEFSCKDRRCIKRSWVCDGQPDCMDGSDEPSGCVKVCKQGFHCFRSLRCIDRSLVCNDFNDCGDNSDELHCGQIFKRNNVSYCSIEKGRFQCPDNKCLSIQQVCDGTKDCEDGSDEGDGCEEDCPPDCGESGGSCFHGPRGALCFAECPLGTIETPEGCTTRPALFNSSVAQLLEEVPFLASRHRTKFAHAKVQALYSFSLKLADVMRCQLGTATHRFIN